MFGEGMAPREIAEHKGCTVNNIYNQLEKIRARLSRLLKKRMLPVLILLWTTGIYFLKFFHFLVCF
jgi:hypothetical protein